MKNIVICIDGTGNEFGAANSNVVKLYSILECDPNKQLAFYHPGLGTMGAPNALSRLSQWWTKMLGLAFGYGLASALTDCYGFLMDNYEEGDTVYLFGFSRGAYCARALAAMLHMFGLVRKGNNPLIPYLLRMFKKKKKQSLDFQVAAKFKATFSRPCKPHFVGVWDTVSSIGWMYDPVTLPFTFLNPDIKCGRQAISIDERRCAFRQNLWSQKVRPQQDIKQVWFAGVHSDVGGGYLEKESGLAKVPLQWMIDEAVEQGLLIIPKKKDQILGVVPDLTKPDCSAEMHNSLTGWWWPLEFLPRRYMDMSAQPPRLRWKIPLARPRYIDENAVIHESVYERMKCLPSYRPVNLPKRNSNENDL